MRKIIKNILRLIIVGTTTLFMAACYGTPMMNNTELITVRKKIKTVDGNNRPIPGLSVEFCKDGRPQAQALTNETGIIHMESEIEIFEDEVFDINERNYTFVVTDIDDEENGGAFELQTIKITEEDSYTAEMQKITE